MLLNRKVDLDKSPSHTTDATAAKVTQKSLEDSRADVNVVDGTSHALVSHLDVDRLALGLNADSLATERVAVGLGAHLDVREGNNHGVVVVGPATGAKTRVEEGDVALEGAGAEVLASHDGGGPETSQC